MYVLWNYKIWLQTPDKPETFLCCPSSKIFFLFNVPSGLMYSQQSVFMEIIYSIS